MLMTSQSFVDISFVICEQVIIADFYVWQIRGQIA
jgi:hypothetical protein